MADTIVLGIESSCDETSVALVADGRKVLSNIIFSQIAIHEPYGGVVPEIASRKHIESVTYAAEKAFQEAGLGFNDIDCVAVTAGPGLVGALLVGLSYGKALAFSLNKPLLGIHHIEAHICANYIDNPDWEPPFIALVVSGGHTHLVHVKDYSSFEILGRTRDDAAGEAFDKVARALGLGYPGGARLEELAKSGDPLSVNFPRPNIEGLDFSFSGLKSAVLNYLNSNKMQNTEINTANVAASFQNAVCDVLVNKALIACKERKLKKLALAGGVSCNSYLREALAKACKKSKIALNIPKPVYCTDNGAMIASCGYFRFKDGKIHNMDLNAYPSAVLGSSF